MTTRNPDKEAVADLLWVWAEAFSYPEERSQHDRQKGSDAFGPETSSDGGHEPQPRQASYPAGEGAVVCQTSDPSNEAV